MVLVDVVVVVMSQPLHVLAQLIAKISHKRDSNNCSHCFNGSKLVLFLHREVVTATTDVEVVVLVLVVELVVVVEGADVEEVVVLEVETDVVDVDVVLVVVSHPLHVLSH